MQRERRIAVTRGGVFSLFSALATIFPMLLGQMLWPSGLSSGMENVFWPATGIQTAGLLLLGKTFWPAVFIGTFVGQMVMGRPMISCLVNAGGNSAEAFLVVWILHRFVGEDLSFRRLRSTILFMAVALVAPLCSSLPGAATLIANGWIPLESYERAVVVWTFANAVGLLFLTPFLIALHRKEWGGLIGNTEFWLWLILTFVCGFLAFDAVFRVDRGANLAFLAFPPVIYAAVRFGIPGVTTSLVLTMLFVYTALAWYAPILEPEYGYQTLWFVQAFCLVLGGTGLLLASAVCERMDAEQQAVAEHRRALEASLGEERARLAALRYQINPHFLFNALNSISAVLPANANKPHAMLCELASYLRSTLDHPARDLIPLREEIDSIQNYLAIQQHRYGQALQATVSVEEDAKAWLVPAYLLQPLVENAIRHGLESHSDPFHLEVRAQNTPKHLVVEVINSGPWKTLESTSGVGLGNIRKRLELLYGDQANFTIFTENDRVHIRIELPVEKCASTFSHRITT